MSTLASTLLDFILDLFRDPAKAAAYENDPQGALDAAGLGDSSPSDVEALKPIVTDHATVGGWGGRDDSCGDDDKGSHGYRPAARDEHDEDRDSGVSPASRDHDHDHDHDDHDHDHDHGHGHGGVSPATPAPAGSETVVITHLQNIQYTNTETHVSIDASHSIWVSGDAQAIFGDVRGDVTQIDNEGGIVAGDDVSHSGVDNSDNSVNDSGNTNVEVDIEDSPINLGGNQAVDSLNGNDIGSHNQDNDVIADRGGQVGDNTAVVVDDVTVVNDSYNGNDLSTDNSVNGSLNGNDLSSTDNSVNGSFNGNDLSDDDGVDDSFNGNDLSQDNVGNDYSEVDASINDSFQDNSDDDGLDLDDVGNGSGNDYSETNTTIEDNDDYTSISSDDDFNNNDDNAFALGGAANTGSVEVD
ncbi:hypothetical protein GCU56_19905 [Geodermatophilus sabuli]|uniref:Uncharacterized protein n=1 Tax=Geodermatophilus sabuli TaxID=1564158 RepID=A0A7K3W5I5_9ACTN|nr:IniB N-terminal domain-containing protein [Geodermatophilus sabuli]NEK60126.1 hypothetical protein [Geodermatophilus sabuli]